MENPFNLFLHNIFSIQSYSSELRTENTVVVCIGILSWIFHELGLNFVEGDCSPLV